MVVTRIPIYIDDFSDGVQNLPVLSGNGTVTETGGALVVSCTAGQNMDWRNGKMPYVGANPQTTFNKIYYEFTIKSWTSVGNAQVWGILHQDDSNLYFIYSSDAVNFYTYRIIGGGWAAIGGPIVTSLPRKFRFVWDRSLATLAFQCQTSVSPPVWTNIVADQAMQISPTRLGLTLRNWSGYPAATVQFEDVEIYAESFQQLTADSSGFEDTLFFPSAGSSVSDTNQMREGWRFDEQTPAGFEDQSALIPAGGPADPMLGIPQGLAHADVAGVGFEDQGGPIPAGGPADPMSGISQGWLGSDPSGFEDTNHIEAVAPTYAKSINDADGRETLGYSAVRQLLLYDATLDPWHSHGTGHYGAGRDGVLYYNGVPCGPGNFGTIAGGIRRTAWATAGEYVDRFPVARASEISMPVDDTIRFTAASPNNEFSSTLRWFLTGDFDIQVNYNVISVGSGPSDGGMFIQTVMDWNNYTYCRRRIFGGGSPNWDKDVRNNGSWESYSSVGGGSGTGSGKLRITRVGSTVSSYYWTGSAWTPIGSSYAMTYNRPMCVTIGYGFNSTPAGHVSEISGFVINSGSTTNLIGWAREVAGTYRGSQAAFPQRALVASSGNGFDLLDADTGKLWMSFRGGSNYFVGGDANYYIRQVAIKDGTLLVAYRTFDSFGTNDGWAAWVDFTLDFMRLHRGPGYNDSGLIYNVELTTGVWPRDTPNGSISWRNSARGFYASHFDNWQFQNNRANWCDLLHDSGFQYRAVANNGGTYVAKWTRWKFEGSTNAHLDTPDYGKSTKTTAMQWVLFDPSTKALYYHDRNKLYVVAFATWSAVLSGAGGTWVETAEYSFAGRADSHQAVIEAQDKMILYGGYLWYARAQGIYRMDVGTGISTLFYGHSASGALYGVLPEYATVLSLQQSMDGAIPVLAVSLHRLHDGQTWTQVALIDLSTNLIHGLGPLSKARSGYALAV